MNFNFPGQQSTTNPKPSGSTHVYRIEENEPNNARVACDYVQFSSTHALFWEEMEPWDQLIIAIPLGVNAHVYRDREEK